MHLVLLPGLDGTGVLMRPLLAALPREITPVVVTYPPDEPLGYDALLPRVLAALPTGTPFAVLGESFGGPLAIRVAAARPRGLAALVLCATFVRSPHPAVPQWAGHAVRPAAMRLFPPFAQLKMMLGGYSTPALRALSAEALALVRPEVLAVRLRDVLRVDVTDDLASCAVPVLYVRGRYDRVVPAHNLREVRRLRPSIEVAVLPAPHLVLQTQPAAAADAIAEFLARAARPAPGS